MKQAILIGFSLGVGVTMVVLSLFIATNGFPVRA